MAPSTIWNDFKQWNVRHGTFSPVQREESYQDEPFLDAKEEDSHRHERERPPKLRQPWFWTTINVMILGATVLVNFMHYLPSHPSCSSDSTQPVISSHAMSEAVRATSYYSPILNDIEVEVFDVVLNGTLWPDKNPSWARAEPGPEIDAIWHKLEPDDVFHVTGEDIVAMGGDLATAVKFPDDIGLGDNAYMASLDVLHKAHCLNELRKMTFEDYREEAPVKTKRHGRLWWVHLRHCVDMLMQDQMCHADADIVYYNWVDVQKSPWPQFSINRRCRNWDQVLNWASDRYVDYDKYVNLTKPAKPLLPFERGYYEAHGFEHSTMYPDGEGYEW